MVLYCILIQPLSLSSLLFSPSLSLYILFFSSPSLYIYIFIYSLSLSLSLSLYILTDRNIERTQVIGGGGDEGNGETVVAWEEREGRRRRRGATIQRARFSVRNR
jgi:hypothetical protein